MLGRGRMRRGVSLEVIVEEDDNAEVMLDPTPIMENDDEGHDEEDEDYSENGSSTPGSPSGSGGGAGGGGGRSDKGGGGGSSGAEERRKKRERRRTIGGLSRVRSVSCEALTLLDTSDMDSCCSEWDDDDDMSTGSSHYVTLNRPISRRRILESSQSQCDSEDSGIEYQSNEDDPMLEDQSRIEDRKDVDQSSDDIHEQETATESDDDDDAASQQVQDGSVQPGPAVGHGEATEANAHTNTDSNVDDEARIDIDAEAETIIDANADANTNADVSTSVDADVEESTDTSTFANADASFDTIPDASTEANAGISTDVDSDAIPDANADANTDKSMHINVEATSATTTDSNEDVLLSAKTGKHLFEERSKQGARHDQTTTTTATKYLQEYTANEVLENDKLVIVETTPPVPTKRPAASQGAVDAAEEELQLKRAAYTIRNKEVQLEELPRPHTVRSVKQLFEDLKTPVSHFQVWRNLGRFRAIKSNPSSKILRFDRSDSTEGANPGYLGVGSSFTLPRLPRHQTRASAHTLESSTLPKVSQKLQPQQEVANTQGGQPVMLRKPMVRGFNVKKALLEDPRTFHPRDSQTTTTNTSQHPTNNNKQTNNHHNRKNHVHFAKKRSHHPSDATTDRSDTESLASDISEDSGVSNDSNTSSASSGSISTYRAFDAYASDPSFKWIDPDIMAKIRSVGTTVIFFGPRPRPRHQDGTVHKTVKTTPSGLQVPRGGVPTSGVPAAAGRSSNTTIRPAQKDVSRSSPVPAPRIVGVVRKRNPSTSGCPQPTPAPTPTDPCSDVARASTPGRCQ